LQRIEVPGRRALACVLGGPERRTLFCLSAATSYEELRQRKSSSRIDTVEVEVADAGNSGTLTRFPSISIFVMAGLVPAIHVFLAVWPKGRGCPAQGRA
jgi:hypothetical protein